MDNILQTLENLINTSSGKVLELQNTYTSYISELLDEINTSIETEISVVIFNGAVFKTINVESIFKNENLEIMIKSGSEIFSWNDLNIFSMDILINHIHIRLLTEINLFKLSNKIQ